MSIKATQPEDSADSANRILGLAVQYGRANCVGNVEKSAALWAQLKAEVMALATPPPQPAAQSADAVDVKRLREALKDVFHDKSYGCLKQRTREALDAALSQSATHPEAAKAEPAEAKTAAVDGMTDAKRMAFLAYHWQSTFKGMRLHEWIVANLLREGSLRKAIDAAIATQEGGQP